MWEYASMWHRAKWSGTEATDWDLWVVAPEATEAPPPDVGDDVALNFMGRAGWEVVHVDLVLDMPPGVTNTVYSRQRFRYLFKRPLPG
jgi:hypothetical protein